MKIPTEFQLPSIWLNDTRFLIWVMWKIEPKTDRAKRNSIYLQHIAVVSRFKPNIIMSTRGENGVVPWTLLSLWLCYWIISRERYSGMYFNASWDENSMKNSWFESKLWELSRQINHHRLLWNPLKESPI